MVVQTISKHAGQCADAPGMLCAQCCTCNFCGCGEIFEFIFAGLGTAWWAIASVVLMQKSFAANNANIPVRTGALLNRYM